ncbi:MAG: ankyrin repeat domain-containing protein [Gammaproteobacteria bacterium]|nr:ankyrin repeat domain-containing protein [Gammaproteobacteria bacterium]
MTYELHEAALKGEVEKVMTLLDQDHDPLQADEVGRYPIFCALQLPTYHATALKQQKETIYKKLLPYYDNVSDYHDRSGETIIHYMAKYNYDKLLMGHELKNDNSTTTLHTENNVGQKPIHYAIMRKNEAIFERLFQSTEDKTSPDRYGQNLIHHIAHYGTPTMLRTFCNAIGDVSPYIEAKDHNGFTPAQIAINFNTTSDVNEIMDILVEHGAKRESRAPSPFS